MKSLLNSVVACALSFVSVQVVAQSTFALAPPAYGSPFEKIKTFQEQALELGGSKAQKIEVQRKVLETRYGTGGVQNIFGDDFLNPTIVGIDRTTRLATSDNPNQAKGHLRERIYANAFEKGGKFRVLETGKKLGPEFGGTDIDIHLQHIESGLKVAVESKQVKLENQNVDEYRIKVQRLAAYSKSTGEPFGFINRYGLKPEIRALIKKTGGFVFENVTTGKQSGQKPGNMRFSDMEDNLSQTLQIKTRSSLVGGVGEMGMGIWMLAQSAPETLADLEDVLNSDTRNKQAVLQLGEHGALSLSAISVSAAGASHLIAYSKVASDIRTLNTLGEVSKWGGRAGVAFFLVSEGFVIAEWQTGGLNDRQFYTIQGGLGGGLVGGAGGTVVFAWVGGVIGALFGPEGIPIGAGIGGLIGGLGGGIGGSSLGAGAVDRIYQSKDEAQKAEIQNFIYQHYGVAH